MLIIQVNVDSLMIILFGQIIYVQYEVECIFVVIVLGMQFIYILLEDLGVLCWLLLFNSGEQDMDINELMILFDCIVDVLLGVF